MNIHTESGSKKTVAFALLQDFSSMGLTIFTAAMMFVNRRTKDERYVVRYYSLNGDPVTGSTLRDTAVDGRYDNIREKPDYIVVCGGSGIELYRDKPFLAWLRYWSRLGAHVVGISSGVHALAQAGLLDGRIACVHWSEINLYRVVYPKVHVRRSHFAIDGPVSSCSGGTSSLDLVLHLITLDQNEAIATQVSREFQHEHIRTGADLQRGVHLGGEVLQKDQLLRAIQLVEDDPQKDWSVPELAKGVGMSDRHLRRLFREAFGMSPNKFIVGVRLRLAREFLQTTKDSISDIAYDCGFSSPSYFCQCYRRVYQVTPSKDRAWYDTAQIRYREHDD